MCENVRRKGKMCFQEDIWTFLCTKKTPALQISCPFMATGLPPNCTVWCVDDRCLQINLGYLIYSVLHSRGFSFSKFSFANPKILLYFSYWDSFVHKCCIHETILSAVMNAIYILHCLSDKIFIFEYYMFLQIT